MRSDFTIPTAAKNNPKTAGASASKIGIFGEFNRFSIEAIHATGQSVVWVVRDADKLNANGHSTEVARGADAEKLMANITGEKP